jgi:uncharacterized protein YycO
LKRGLLFFSAILLFLALLFAGLRLAGKVELRDLQSLRQPTALVQVLAAAGRGEFGIGDYDNVPNNLDISNLQAGDIILGGNPGGSYGRYTHAGFYIGDDQVMDMYTSDGVYVASIEAYRDYTWVAVLRVNTSPEIRAAATNYVKQQVGTPFFILAPKTDDGLWYCSKLVWYAYYRYGIDLDAFHNSYWIVPDAILHSPKTTLISFSGTRP